MKKHKVVVAVLTALMMVLTLAPAGVWAVSAEKITGGKYKEPAGGYEDYIEEIRQMAISYLEECYKEFVKEEKLYCSPVWNEIQQTYSEGRQAISTLTEEDLMEDSEDFKDYFGILEELGAMTWVKKPGDLSVVKSKYIKEIDSEYKYYKASDYSDYYWDMIQDCLFMGKRQLNSAKTFGAAAEGYLIAISGMDMACDLEEIKELRDMVIIEIKYYANLVLDPAQYSPPIWNRIIQVRDKAISQLKATQLESEMLEIYEETGKGFVALTGVPFPFEGKTIVDELTEKLENYVDSVDEELYSEDALDKMYYIAMDAEDAMYEAASRAQAQKIYDNAMAKIKAVPTKKQEIAAIQKTMTKITSVRSVNSESVKVSWKKAAGAHGYVVYRATTAKGKYSKIKMVRGTSFKDTKLKLGKAYYYKVRPYKSIDEKLYYGKTSKGVKGTPMLAKASLSLSKSGKSAVQLKWKTVKDAKGYEVYRATSYNGAYKKVKTIKSAKAKGWKDTDVKKGKNYYYKVRSYCKVKGKTKYSPYSAIKKIKR